MNIHIKNEPLLTAGTINFRKEIIVKEAVLLIRHKLAIKKTHFPIISDVNLFILVVLE